MASMLLLLRNPSLPPLQDQTRDAFHLLHSTVTSSSAALTTLHSHCLFPYPGSLTHSLPPWGYELNADRNRVCTGFYYCDFRTSSGTWHITFINEYLFHKCWTHFVLAQEEERAEFTYSDGHGNEIWLQASNCWERQRVWTIKPIAVGAKHYSAQSRVCLTAVSVWWQDGEARCAGQSHEWWPAASDSMKRDL